MLSQRERDIIAHTHTCAEKDMATTFAPARRALARLACGGVACVAGWHSVTYAAAQPTDAQLGSTWTQAVDGMISVPGCSALSSPEGILYMAPKVSEPESRSFFKSKTSPVVEQVVWPRIFAKSVVFSMTAWNPMGKDSPMEQNVYRNSRLAKEISELRRPEPRAVWHSYGFNAHEGWREDGFSIAYAWEERVYGQVAILKLARKYEQAAVYMYSVDKDTGELVREVLWVDARKHKEHGTKETMQVLKEPPQTPLADPAYWSSSSASEGA